MESARPQGVRKRRHYYSSRHPIYSGSQNITWEGLEVDHENAKTAPPGIVVGAVLQVHYSGREDEIWKVEEVQGHWVRISFEGGDYWANFNNVIYYSIMSTDFTFQVGDRVTAKWHSESEEFLPGTIADKPADWVFVRFDDGDNEFIPVDWIQKGESTVGSRVYAKFFHDDGCFHGTVANNSPDDYEFVKFDDGDEAYVFRLHIRRA